MNATSVVELTALAPTLVAYDRPFFPGDRTPFLERWLTQPESYSLGLLHQERLVGYGVVRPCQMPPGQTGYKIGPLFADTVEGAEALFLGLRRHIHRQEIRKQSGREEGAEPYQVYLDVPEPNPAGVDLAKRYGMTPMFETARMYAGQVPELPVEQIFGVTTFELG